MRIGELVKEQVVLVRGRIDGLLVLVTGLEEVLFTVPEEILLPDVLIDVLFIAIVAVSAVVILRLVIVLGGVAGMVVPGGLLALELALAFALPELALAFSFAFSFRRPSITET